MTLEEEAKDAAREILNTVNGAAHFFGKRMELAQDCVEPMAAVIQKAVDRTLERAAQEADKMCIAPFECTECDDAREIAAAIRRLKAEG